MSIYLEDLCQILVKAEINIVTKINPFWKTKQILQDKNTSRNIHILCFINDTPKLTVHISLVFYRHIMHAFIFVIVILISEMISHCIQRYLSISLIHILIFWKIALFIGNIINYFYNLYLSGNNMLYHVFHKIVLLYILRKILSCLLIQIYVQYEETVFAYKIALFVCTALSTILSTISIIYI